jgi:hypothetical protein
MKILFLTIALMGLSFTVFPQEECDTIYSNNGKLIVFIKEVTSDAIIYQYPGENFTNSLYKNSINKIIFSSGRTEIFTVMTNENKVKSGKDWEKVSITSLESEILGLNKIGEVTTRAKGGSEFANVDKIKDKAYRKLKIEAAMHGANKVFLLSENVKGNEVSFFAENATETNLTGIAYSIIKPSFTEFKNILEKGNLFKSVETQLLKNYYDDLEFFSEKKDNSVYLNNAREESGQIKVKALVPNVNVEDFNVIYFDEYQVTLMYEDEKKIWNIILEKK